MRQRCITCVKELTHSKIRPGTKGMAFRDPTLSGTGVGLCVLRIPGTCLARCPEETWRELASQRCCMSLSVEGTENMTDITVGKECQLKEKRGTGRGGGKQDTRKKESGTNQR